MATKNRELQRKYWRAHYYRNKEMYAARNKARKIAAKKFVNDIKKGRPCLDCHKVYPCYVMDFDHREGEVKLFNVASMVLQAGRSNKSILAEIAKCDLVCSNCHRVRTYNRMMYNKKAG